MQLLLFLGLVTAAVPVLGGFMHRVFTGERTWLTPLLAPVERTIYRLAGCDPRIEMRWADYAVALLWFQLAGFATLLGLQLAQAHLPLNPQQLPNVPFPLALNTAVSFVTNTNWQAYSGESTMSCLTQMLGLTTRRATRAPASWGARVRPADRFP
jgi:K+-transporting ATPase ATPase A chain